MSEIFFRPEAADDLAVAYRWYEDRRPGLGEEFLGVVDAAVEQILRTPAAFPVVHRDVRRALTRRFPFGIFFRDEPGRIVILAVFHGRRDPRTVQRRD
jgi:plasmid stabilization system protein ParE